MKQKVSIYAIIKQDSRVLLLKRAKGREDIIGKLELPGGELPFEQTPHQAAAGFMREQTGLEPTTLQLYDVRAYQSKYDAQMQRIDIVYLAAAQGGSHIELSDRHNKYVWRKMHEIQLGDVTEATFNLLESGHRFDNAEKLAEKEDVSVGEKSTNDRSIIYSDGGSRGNPGPSASGFVILDENEKLIEEGGAYLGITTNNQAEYHAVRLGLEAAQKLGLRSIQFRIDSLLVVNQMTGVYKIKNRDLWPVHERIKELAKQFEHVTFTHIRREFNKEADAMVNKILDEHEG